MQVLADNWSKYDFFFIHFKYTDSTGEDGNFDAKVQRTEEYDAAIPKVMKLKPDVFIATGDHSTPSMLTSHSWHPVPTLLWATNCRTDASQCFGESECVQGRPRPVRSQAPDDARPGERRAARQVRRMTSRAFQLRPGPLSRTRRNLHVPDCRAKLFASFSLLLSQTCPSAACRSSSVTRTRDSRRVDAPHSALSRRS